MRELAPAKINLCLYVGPLRDDGYHEFLSVMQAVDLSDALTLSDHAGPGDEVRCPGLEGPNLAARAIVAFRELTGWDGPPQLLEIDKRIPVAAGLGGGSADAAATLRLLARRSGIDIDLHALATSLGADVPSQLRPGRWLAEGIGERLTRLPDPDPFGVLIMPSQAQLSTAAVYAEADRLGLTRTSEELARIRATLDLLAPEPVNDLARAASSLEPTIGASLATAWGEGSFVTGSGPTLVRVFPTLQDARGAARRLAAAGVAAYACASVHNSSFT
ncbi:MAG: 4-diphosphocytidyl-2C-methyl-D-erythritol kinase [Solirubrobacteraceae bacterium]|jgi:4-diphosphocytidyl-2-C-methyl-D-erythritol kinase